MRMRMRIWNTVITNCSLGFSLNTVIGTNTLLPINSIDLIEKCRARSQFHFLNQNAQHYLYCIWRYKQTSYWQYFPVLRAFAKERSKVWSLHLNKLQLRLSECPETSYKGGHNFVSLNTQDFTSFNLTLISNWWRSQQHWEYTTTHLSCHHSYLPIWGELLGQG